MRLTSNNILPLLLLLTLFASCSKDEYNAVTEREICFSGSSLVPVVTRSGATETLPTDYKMWVAAIYHNQYNTAHSYYFGASIEKKFAWDTKLSVWKGLEDLYYPFSGAMDFLAYAVQKDEHKPTPTYTPATLSASENTFSTLTLDFGTKLDGTDAVVFSDLRSGAPCGNQSTQQNLQFRHAMSKIQFMANTEDTEAASRFTIHRITVKSVKTSGVLQITPAITTQINIGENTATIGSTSTWTQTNGAEQNLDTYDNTTGMHPRLSATEGNIVGNPLYLPTQSSSPQAISIDLKYSILNGTGYSSTQQHVITITLPAVQWLPEHQYTYTLSCSLTQITVSVVDSASGAILDCTPESIDIDEQYHNDSSV